MMVSMELLRSWARMRSSLLISAGMCGVPLDSDSDIQSPRTERGAGAGSSTEVVSLTIARRSLFSQKEHGSRYHTSKPSAGPHPVQTARGDNGRRPRPAEVEAATAGCYNLVCSQ